MSYTFGQWYAPKITYEMSPRSIGYDTYARNSIVESYDQFRAFSGPYINIIYEKNGSKFIKTVSQCLLYHFPFKYQLWNGICPYKLVHKQAEYKRPLRGPFKKPLKSVRFYGNWAGKLSFNDIFINSTVLTSHLNGLTRILSLEHDSGTLNMKIRRKCPM